MTFEFHSKLVGHTFIEGSQDIIKQLEPKMKLTLKHDEDNEHDSNAIGVYLQDEENSIRIGYIPRDTAAKVVQDVKEAKVICEVSEITGGVQGKENVGCNLKLTIDREDKNGE